jgi:hypothetical protein
MHLHWPSQALENTWTSNLDGCHRWKWYPTWTKQNRVMISTICTTVPEVILCYRTC